MGKHLRFILGVTIISISIFLPKIEKIFVPVEPSVVQVLSIPKPSEEALARVSGAKELVTDQIDRDKMSLLNFEFSNRLKGYECPPENMIKVWNEVARYVSDGKWEKYKGFAPKYTSELIREITTDANSPMTDKEKELISERFSALSWTLGNKDE